MEEIMNRLAIGKLRTILGTMEDGTDKDLASMSAAKVGVLDQFQPIFALDDISNMTEDEFRSFLLLKNNRHWSGLHRQSNVMCADMGKLRSALAILVDEGKPINDRLNQLIPMGGKPMVQGLGRATITAILQIAFPDKYGVLNGTVETAMKSLDIWPKFEYGATFAKRYLAVNEILLQVSSELHIDLWILDALWWRVRSPYAEEADTVTSHEVLDTIEEESPRFGLEKYLQEFLRDNWDQISELSDSWELYEEDGEVRGYEYDTIEIGRIDLLARHKEEPRWLVIELKRNQSSDQTIGQVLRYMGWVRNNLASQSDQVEGMIMCHSSDRQTEYALVYTKNVEVMFYRVAFHLSKAPVDDSISMH